MHTSSFGWVPFASGLRGRAPVSLQARAAAACHRVEPGHAITIEPRCAGRVSITQGRAWVTLGGPYQGPLNDLGDRFLQAGESLDVPAGAKLVMEPLGLPGDSGPVTWAWGSRTA